MLQLAKSDRYLLIEELNALTNWEMAVEYARNVYGPTAVKLSVDTESEYNDEGGYYDVITDVSAENEDGASLEFDLTTEFWNKVIEANRNNRWNPTPAEDNQSNWEDWANDIAIDFRHEDLPAMSATYDLTKPPSRIFKQVLVEKFDSEETND